MSHETGFDPYRKWLGIPPEEQPPNYYRLLGIPPFESDPDVIINAADRQMGHVRRFQAGRYAAICQRVLNELAAARVCLLDPVRKRAYDQKLFFEFQAAGRELPFPVAKPLKAREIPPPEAFEDDQLRDGPRFSVESDDAVAFAPGALQNVIGLYRPRKNIWREPTTVIMLAVLFLMAVVAAVLVVFRQQIFG